MNVVHKKRDFFQRNVFIIFDYLNELAILLFVLNWRFLTVDQYLGKKTGLKCVLLSAPTCHAVVFL